MESVYANDDQTLFFKSRIRNVLTLGSQILKAFQGFVPEGYMPGIGDAKYFSIYQEATALQNNYNPFFTTKKALVFFKDSGKC